MMQRGEEQRYRGPDQVSGVHAGDCQSQSRHARYSSSYVACCCVDVQERGCSFSLLGIKRCSEVVHLRAIWFRGRMHRCMQGRGS